VNENSRIVDAFVDLELKCKKGSKTTQTRLFKENIFNMLCTLLDLYLAIFCFMNDYSALNKLLKSIKKF
jgi:hypothetical protein